MNSGDKVRETRRLFVAPMPQAKRTHLAADGSLPCTQCGWRTPIARFRRSMGGTLFCPRCLDEGASW